MIGLYGIIFAVVFLPAIALCMASKKYLFLGVIMGSSWIMHLGPVRSIFEFGDQSLYFVIIETITALLLLKFTYELLAARLIAATIGLLLLVAYLPLYVGYIPLRGALVTSDIIGYIQICILYGGAIGHIRRYNSNSGDNRGRLHNLANNKLFKSMGVTPSHSKPVQK